MAKITALTANNLPIIFNVTGAVGRGGANMAEDVQLVTWLLCRLRENRFEPGVKAALAKVEFSSACTPTLITAIEDLQEHSGLTRDGRVDPCTNPSGNGSRGPMMITALNLDVKKNNRREWPRLDEMFHGEQMRGITQKCLFGMG
jgi:murein L,D-transpeptidase YcbB/YkuD